MTSMEAFAMCTPVITLPKKQTVPSLSAGMIRKMELRADNEKLLLVESTTQYVDSVRNLLHHHNSNSNYDNNSDDSGDGYGTDESLAVRIRKEICDKSVHLFEEQHSVFEWEKFLQRAYHS